MLVNDEYLATLRQELAVWRKVAASLRSQRQAIVQRQAQRVWDSQDEIHDLLYQVAAAHAETARRKPQVVGQEAEVLEQQLRQTQQATQDEIRLNHELLRDICSYLDMIREVLLPEVNSATYTHPRTTYQSVGSSLTGTRVA